MFPTAGFLSILVLFVWKAVSLFVFFSAFGGRGWAVWIDWIDDGNETARCMYFLSLQFSLG